MLIFITLLVIKAFFVQYLGEESNNSYDSNSQAHFIEKRGISDTDAVRLSKGDAVSSTTFSSKRWADTRFLFRKNFTIPNSNIYGNLTDFPILLEIYDEDLKNNTSFDNFHLLFTNKYGKILPHEIELFNPEHNETHCHLITWVRTNLTTIDNNMLSMYYGVTTSDIQTNPEQVWTNQYLGVWHLSENSGTRYDSTSNSLDLSPQNYNNDEGTIGIIGGADDFDGDNDYLESYKTPIEIGLDGKKNKTISMWIYTREFTSGGLFEFGQFATKRFFSLRTQNSVNEWKADWWSTSNTFSFPSENIWIHLVITYNNETLEIYANSELMVNSTQNLNTGEKITLRFGTTLNQSFSGKIDEIRISKNTRPEEWIKTEYLNQKDPSGFYLMGNQEVDITAPIIHNFGINSQGKGCIDFFARVEDDYTAVKNVTIKIGASFYQMQQNSTGFWVYNHTPIYYGEHLNYQILNTSDYFGNFLSETSEEKEYIYLIDQENPEIKTLYFLKNNERNPTNLTFYSEILEDGSGIDNVTLYYYFEEIRSNETGKGASIIQSDNVSWSQVLMDYENESEGIYLFKKTIPFLQNETTWRIIFQIDTIDKCGNTNYNAFSNNPENASQSIISFNSIPTLDNPMINDLGQHISLIIISFLIFLMFSSVYGKFIRKPTRLGKNPNFLLLKSKRVSEKEIKRVIDNHTIGIVISYFDQHKGPTPILSVPISLENESNSLMNLAVQSFSTCKFSRNYENLSHAIFSYSHENSHKTINLKSISYTFVIVRPEARGGVENLSLSVLAYENVARLINQFPELLDERVKRIQNLIDKDTDDQLIILNEMDEFRKMISRIVLSYKKVYH
jgi:hypothetical protein